QERGLVRIRDADLGDHPAAEDHDGAVADQLYFLQLGRVEQHGGTGLGEVPQQQVDLLLRPDVDAASGVEAQHRVHSSGDPAGDPSTSSSPPAGRSEPARMSNSSSWPWPSSATTPSTSPG